MKKLKLFTSLTATTAVIALMMACQSQTINGRVIDIFGEPIEGISVQIADSRFESTTNSDGEYELDYAPSEKIKLTYMISIDNENTDFASDYYSITLSISQKSYYPMEDVVLCMIPNKGNGLMWSVKGTALDTLPLLALEKKTFKVEGEFLPIDPTEPVIFYQPESDKGKKRIFYPILIPISEQNRLIIENPYSSFPFKGHVYSEFIYEGELVAVGKMPAIAEIPKGRYMLCLLDAKRQKISGKYHGVEIL